MPFTERETTGSRGDNIQLQGVLICSHVWNICMNVFSVSVNYRDFELKRELQILEISMI